jgi:hypothetical protein
MLARLAGVGAAAWIAVGAIAGAVVADVAFAGRVYETGLR